MVKHHWNDNLKLVIFKFLFTNFHLGLKTNYKAVNDLKKVRICYNTLFPAKKFVKILYLHIFNI